MRRLLERLYRARIFIALALAVILCIGGFHAAMAGPDSGGSMGGSGFGGGGGGGGGGHGAGAEILFYIIWYGGRLLFSTVPGAIVGCILIVIGIIVWIQNQRKDAAAVPTTKQLPPSLMNIGDRQGGPYVVMVQMAFPAAGFNLRARFNELARSGNTATRNGLASLLEQVCTQLEAASASVRYAALVEDGPQPTLMQLEQKFRARAAEERGRFRRDTVRAEQGKLVTDQKDRLTNTTRAGYIVVTVLVAFGRPLPAQAKAPASAEDVRALLAGVRGIASGASVYALEVIWTPAAEGDVLEEAELLPTFPALAGGGGARAMSMACPFCGQPFDASLPQCPSCGGANTGSIR